jgi:UDP-N-acetylglucosamine transferase subunit ALG13
MRAADAIVAHAGMGTILTALELGTPIVVMPRRAALGEHRNDHQLATARRFAEQGSIAVAFDEEQLHARLDVLGPPAATCARRRIGRHAEGPLIEALRTFIAGGA